MLYDAYFYAVAKIGSRMHVHDVEVISYVSTAVANTSVVAYRSFFKFSHF